MLRFIVIVALAGSLGGSWYLAKRGFSRETRYRITEELRKHGVEAHIRRLTLDPFRGLVARDVRIFDYKKRENTLAVISEISLDLNYAALLHRQPFLNAFDIRNARVTLPFQGVEGKIERAQLTNLRAHVYFPPDQIYVSQAEGIFCGVRISATGQLIKRPDYQPSPPLSEEEWQKRLSILQRVVTELQQFSFSRSRPSLQVKFTGDVAQLENAHVEASLRGEQLRRENYEMRDLVVAAEWSSQRLNVTQCEWADRAGAFSGHAAWSRETNDADFQARSSIELKSFLETLGLKELVSEITFDTPPVIEFAGSARFGNEKPRLKVLGHAVIEKFNYRSVPFTDLNAGFSWDGERTLLRDVRVRNQGGQLAAELFDAPNDFRLNIDSTIDPSVLGALASPEMRKFLSEWEWQQPPALHLAIRAQDRHPVNWRGDGTVALDRTRFRGIWMNNARADVHFGDGAVTYNNLRVTRDEGTATGAFTYDFAKHEVRISNVKSSLRPVDVIFWIEPDQYKNVVPYKFKQAPNITANGVYQFRGGKNTRLEIKVDAPGGMDYVFLGKTLPFNRIFSKLLFTNDRLQLVDLAGGLFSGTVRGGADISLARNDPHFRAKIAVDGIDFPRLTDLYYQYKSAQGHLSGSYDFKGLGDNARHMSGTGKVEVTDGDVFAIPVFGPISDILNAILPGSGYSIARKATASFTIKDGIIHTEDFETAGKLFSMLGRGDLYFLDDKLDFELRMSAHGPGVLLTPMYKLFEYTGEGSLKKPNWHPKRF
jgi:AsmA-like protein